MIGNDIVDLALAQQESNWQRKGFLHKLFTDKEQHLILNSNNPELMVWNLWSRKEACYKIYNRASGQRVFNPIQFECEADRVVFGDNIFYTQTEITPDYVYTIA
ncbi:4'-phosphopantetheinyl transferase superfamily protein, partial [Flavobacterium sp.]|uniref:4'-phosphopantetheinyl transferase family protein n=1 Tax=Flavobacterium sp. TaxID=239 RepID=UPI00391AB074